RSLRLVAEVLLADADSVREHAVEAQGALRLGLSAAHSRSLDGGLQADRDPRRSASVDSERERREIVWIAAGYVAFAFTRTLTSGRSRTLRSSAASHQSIRPLDEVRHVGSILMAAVVLPPGELAVRHPDVYARHRRDVIVARVAEIADAEQPENGARGNRRHV